MINELWTNFKNKQNLIPVFSKLNNKTISLDIIFLEELEKDANIVFWKKFRDPEFNKYVVGRFYRYQPQIQEEKDNWCVVCLGSLFYYIDYETKTISTGPEYNDEILDTVINLARGNMRLDIFSSQKRSLIL